MEIEMRLALIGAVAALAMASSSPPAGGLADTSASPKGRTKNRLLGRFEYSVLRAIESLGDDAYGARIGVYLSDQLKKPVTAPQVYMTLERLAKQGFVRSEATNPLPQQGGRSRRRFMIEAEGARAMARTQAAFSGSPSSQQEDDYDATGRETVGSPA
jgi:PadR family transcriptional regulator PadR